MVIQKYFTSIDDSSEMPPGSPARNNGARTPVGDRQDTAANELKTELAAIFKKIGDKRTTQNGIECLYQFQQDHPEVDVKPFLSNTSTAFQSYIERGLKLIEDRLKPSEPDPMEIDEPVEHIEDMQISWTETPDANQHWRETPEAPASSSEDVGRPLHRSINT